MAKQISSENRKPLIDATPKKDLTITDPTEVSAEELRREIERLQESLNRIREQHFSSSAALSRIESRSFSDLIRARLYVLQKSLSASKTESQKADKG